MISVIVLICSNVVPECIAITPSQFFSSEQECRYARPSAEEFANNNDAFVADYRCINWGEPS